MKTTIILPLECRPLATFRWLWFVQLQDLTAPIVLVDNGTNRIVEELISGSALFPALDITYLARDGACFGDLCMAGVERAATDYVMIGDARSFLYSHGLRRSAAFLDANPDFSAVCGIMLTYDQQPSRDPDFDTVGGACIAWRSVFEPWEVADDSCSMRVQLRLGYEIPASGFLQRRPVIREALREAARLDLDERDAVEIFLSGFQALMGFVKFDSAYLSGAHPRAMLAAGWDDVEASYKVMDASWVGRLNRAAKRLGTLVENRDWGPWRAMLFRLHRLYRALRAGGLDPPVSGAEIRVRTGISHYLHDLLGGRLRPVGVQGSADVILGVLASDAPDSVAAGRADLSLSERTLGGEDFIGFVRANASSLLIRSGACP